MSRPIPPPVEWQDAAEATASRRLWAAMLTTNVEVCRSILLGRPVLARELDAVAFRRALRGETTPRPGEYVLVTSERLDAVAEGGSFEPKQRRRR